MDRPRLLFITDQLPYPPVSGGIIKSWRFLEHLCKRFDVTLLTLMKGADRDHEKALLAALPLVGFKGIPFDRARTAVNFARSLFTSPTLNAFRNASPSMRAAVAAEADKHDVLLIDHLEMAQFIPTPPSLPVVLHEHNAEFIMWERSKAVARNVMERIAMTMEAARIKRFERKSCLRADLIFAAPNDQRELEALGVPTSKFRTTYHLGDDSALRAPDLDHADTTMSLLYVGTLSWHANHDGLLWFLNEVWPALKAKHKDLELNIIGRGAEPALLELAGRSPGVKLLGFVEDLEPLFKKSRIFIAPLRFGSGTKVKVVTAMYRGIPCVTTSIGAEGMDLLDEIEIFKADDPHRTQECIEILLNDRQAWEGMRDASRAKAKKDLAWDAMLESHSNDLLALIHPRK